MHLLCLSGNDILTSDTLSRLSSNPSSGPLFPKLEWLDWDIHAAHTALPFFNLFLSPNLRKVSLYISFNLPNIPGDLLPPLVRIISLLPTSIGYVSVKCSRNDEPLKDAVSSYIGRCGSSLGLFEARVPLSKAATDHLMQLPNLTHWTTTQPPPRVVPTSIFPSLKSIHLEEPEALPWLSLLASHERDVLRDGSTSATSHKNVRDTLTSINFPVTIVDSTFLPSITKFRNLVTLDMRAHCPEWGSCNFRLTDDDMEGLAVALPRLSSLRFGTPCGARSCNATVASLLSLSVHCLDLTVLETHFNTKTIVSDMQHLLEGGDGRDEAKPKLRRLVVGRMIPRMLGKDVETVALGFKAIFPCLKGFDNWRSGWNQLESKLANQGELGR